MLMIEVPGNADQKHRKFNRDNIMWGSLRRGHEWFVQTPVLLKVDDGVVLNVFSYENIRSVIN
jgi:hypothetical protein